MVISWVMKFDDFKMKTSSLSARVPSSCVPKLHRLRAASVSGNEIKPSLSAQQPAWLPARLTMITAFDRIVVSARQLCRNLDFAKAGLRGCGCRSLRCSWPS